MMTMLLLPTTTTVSADGSVCLDFADPTHLYNLSMTAWPAPSPPRFVLFSMGRQVACLRHSTYNRNECILPSVRDDGRAVCVAMPYEWACKAIDFVVFHVHNQTSRASLVVLADAFPTNAPCGGHTDVTGRGGWNYDAEGQLQIMGIGFLLVGAPLLVVGVMAMCAKRRVVVVETK